MVDSFLLLLAPGGGDELQGIKRGIVELADLVVINKADGELRAAALRAHADYQAALQLLRPGAAGWTPEVLACSALEGSGIAEVWQAVLRHRQALEAGEGLAARRREQSRSWLCAEVQAGLLEALRRRPGEPARCSPSSRRSVADGRLLPPEAARALIARFRAGASSASRRSDWTATGVSLGRRLRGGAHAWRKVAPMLALALISGARRRRGRGGRRALTPSDDGTWRIDVTVEHADEGWDHYADAFEVVARTAAARHAHAAASARARAAVHPIAVRHRDSRRCRRDRDPRPRQRP